MKIITLLSISLLLVLGSCSNNNNKESAAADKETNTGLPIINYDSIVFTPATNDFAASYEGSIDNKYDISMQLVKTGPNLGGNYSYKSKGKAIQVFGTISPEGKVEISEINKGDITGVFNGELKDGTLSGTWSTPDNSKSMPFTLKQSNIASMSTKADVLSYAIGEYPLQSITGNVGANTMFDTYKEKGEWKSTASSNIGGQREGEDVGINQKDRDMLNNMRIVVDDNMNVHFYAGLIELFNSKFKSTGMDYRVREKDKTKMNEQIAALYPDSFLLNNGYVVLADDKVDYNSTLNSGQFNIVTADNMILYYYPGNNMFELHIFEGACCDGNVITFKKK
ncbi:MAG TPA: hypothetical protein VGF30_10070 [Bacteroidia bacterium]